MTSASLQAWVNDSQHSKTPTWRVSSVGYCEQKELTDIGLGLRFRSSVSGPEQEMVDNALDIFRADVGRGRRLTVFCQPALETGFPDIVGVVWRHATAQAWSTEREQLQTQHLRLLHALASTGWTDIEFLESIFRCRLDRTLDFLSELGLVVKTKNRCRVRSLNNIFAVEKIIAIEAKMSFWQRAIEQAVNNIWFSSESHILMPTISNPTALLECAQQFQIGVLAFNSSQSVTVCDASQRPVPLSYGSWLFNEWVWRIAHRRGEF